MRLLFECCVLFWFAFVLFRWFGICFPLFFWLWRRVVCLLSVVVLIIFCICFALVVFNVWVFGLLFGFVVVLDDLLLCCLCCGFGLGWCLLFVWRFYFWVGWFVCLPILVGFVWLVLLFMMLFVACCFVLFDCFVLFWVMVLLCCVFADILWCVCVLRVACVFGVLVDYFGLIELLLIDLVSFVWVDLFVLHLIWVWCLMGCYFGLGSVAVGGVSFAGWLRLLLFGLLWLLLCLVVWLFCLAFSSLRGCWLVWVGYWFGGIGLFISCVGWWLVVLWLLLLGLFN